MKEARKSKTVFLKEAEISVIIHATEDPSKVKKAITNLFPEEIAGLYMENIEESTYKGHYGNVITFYRIRVKGRDAVKLLKHLLSHMDTASNALLKATLDERVDDAGNLYIRVSKQDAYSGKVALYDGDDVIRLVFRPRYGKNMDWVVFFEEQ
ncbi:MAG: hypothetical protein LRS47_01655 [Desulfurococcales archaeon]|nr:hypothetical protein [Desulfurococcales archaeon]